MPVIILPEQGPLERRLIMPVVNRQMPLGNIHHAYGFLELLKRLEQEGINIFRMNRSNEALNFNIIKRMVYGYLMIEEEGKKGVPSTMLEQMNTDEIASNYLGITFSDGIPFDFSDTNFANFTARVIDVAYRLQSKNKKVANAICVMKKTGVGYHGHNPRTLRQRLDQLPEEDKVKFLRSLERRTRDKRAVQEKDLVLHRHNNGGYMPKVCTAARDEYLEWFVDMMLDKRERGDDFFEEGFYGHLHASRSRPGIEYYTRRSLEGRYDSEIYDCSCPGEEKRKAGVNQRECWHLRELKEEVKDRETMRITLH